MQQKGSRNQVTMGLSLSHVQRVDFILLMVEIHWSILSSGEVRFVCLYRTSSWLLCGNALEGALGMGSCSSLDRGCCGLRKRQG